MTDVTTVNRSKLSVRDRCDRHRRSGQRGELDFVRHADLMNVDDRADVAGFQRGQP